MSLSFNFLSMDKIAALPESLSSAASLVWCLSVAMALPAGLLPEGVGGEDSACPMGEKMGDQGGKWSQASK